jgi:hypothetical protein
VSPTEAGDGAEVHDRTPAPGTQHRDGVLGHQHHRRDVDEEPSGPGLEVDLFGGPSRSGDTDVVHQDVELPEAAQRRLDEPFAVVGSGHVAHGDAGFPHPFVLDHPTRRLGSLGVAVHHEHPRAGTCQQHGGGPPVAHPLALLGTRSRDDGHPSRKPATDRWPRSPRRGHLRAIEPDGRRINRARTGAPRTSPGRRRWSRGIDARRCRSAHRGRARVSWVAGHARRRRERPRPA